MISQSAGTVAEGRATSDVPPVAGPAPGRDRILSAAMARISEDGAAGASVRAIATTAGVSPALVLHHFGSKAGLIAACDAHLVDVVRALKSDALGSGPGLDPVAALAAAAEDAAPLARYLARRLSEGGATVAGLVDRIVDDAHGYVRDGIESGLLRPSAHERERTVLLALWSLGALAMHQHARRLLGFSVVDGAEGVARWGRLATEVLAGGIMTPEAIAAMAGGTEEDA